ncbi:MAG: oligosaccharide flippase family protein [Phenylobacterium sp.]|uniref:oligosaccharide flippase family protein n=1 Tax=Phenylobacterium sp. TaxID=1871053 RepID=UPI00273400E9|nr:oligosaccharide flippase family protein [Phenylobacterium sp.]MDP3174861.1 oligosaccharide flippase family protein [Phenylobacterium sp.]
MSHPAQPGLLAHAGRAAGWAALAKWLNLLIGAGSFLVMVRLLSPDSFGLYGMAVIVLALPEVVVGGPLSESLIQRRDLRPAHASATFWLELTCALVHFAAIVALAPWIAALFGRDELKTLAPVYAATLILLALGSTPASLLQRNLRFKAIAAVDASGAAIAAFVGLGLALADFGVWALVGMESARRAVRAAGFIALAGWLPARPRVGPELRELARFNLTTLATRLLVQVDAAAPRFIVGVLLGAQALGYLNLANRILQQGAAVLIAPFNAVALSVASAARDDRTTMHATLGAASRITAFVAYPAFLGAAALAPLAVPLLLGEHWRAAVACIQIMLLLGIRAATASFNGAVLSGSGRPDLQLALVALGLVSVAVLTPLAATWSLSAVAGALLLRGLVTWWVGAWLVQRVTGYPAHRQITLGWRDLVAAGVMAMTLFGVQSLVVVPPWALLAGLTTLGAAVHLGVLFLLSPARTRRLAAAGAAGLRGDRRLLGELLRAD